MASAATIAAAAAEATVRKEKQIAMNCEENQVLARRASIKYQVDKTNIIISNSVGPRQKGGKGSKNDKSYAAIQMTVF